MHRQDPDPGVLLGLLQGLEGESPAGGAVAVEGLHLRQPEGPVDEHHPVVLGELGVGGGVEEIASHQGGEGEDHGVSGTEGYFKWVW